MAYNFIETLTEGKWTIQIDRDAQYGYFEHDEGGEGGLWFAPAASVQFALSADHPLELMDYDGYAELPKDVATALRRAGYIVGPEFD